MSKRSTKLIILLAALLVCGGVSFAVVSSENAKNATATAPTEATIASETLMSIDTDRVVHVKWVYSDLFSGEITKKDGVWIWTDDPTQELVQEYVTDTFFKYFEDILTYKQVEVESLADVGLEEPYATAWIDLDDGSQIVLEFGDSTAISGYCYMTADGGKTIHVVKRGLKANFGKVLSNFLPSEEEEEE